jgi:hypothetical protein
MRNCAGSFEPKPKIVDMNRKPILFIILSLYWASGISVCAQTFNLSDKLSLKSMKLSPLEDGKGLMIEDFNLFKSNAVDHLMTASGIQTKSDPESIIRSRADSFYAIFKEKKVVAVPKEDMSLLRYFPGMESEPKVLANLIFTLNRLGGTKSFNYAVKKGDTLVIEYQILKGHGFDEFEVLEGKETRFTASRNPKKFQVQHELLVEADGVVTINLENKSPLRSKGRLVVTNRPAAARFSLRYVCDTLFDVAKVMVEKKDTIAEPLLSQQVRLSSKRDITRPSRALVNVAWPAGRQCIGWGYRVADISDSLPELLSEYVITELRRIGMVRLPEEGPADLKMTIRAGTRTLLRDPEGKLFEGDGMWATANPRKYFGAFHVRSNAAALPILRLEVENMSRLYTTTASIQLVGVFVDTHSEETEIVRKTCRDFIMLSYL